jgi:Mg2+-importing ATPase
MALARLNSRFENGIRNTLDDAILAAPLADGEPDYTKARRLGEIPFDFERRRLSVFAATPTLTDQKEGAERFLLITKGAPESVLAVCTSIRDSQGIVTPLDDTVREICHRAYQKSNELGFRVLAVAYRELTVEANPDAGQETQMVLAGFLTLANPPLPDAARMIQKLQEDGVQIKILTGDNELVTAHLCNAIGLAGLKGSEIIMGDQIAHMSDSALGQVAEEANIFARVSPVQKNRIILALKRRGHVVGYIGDGINDAPSLHSADVGISVANGADVARDAAEIILLERSLAVLHDGITEGRRAYGNVLKYLLMNLSSNFGNMVSMAGAAAFLPFLPMLPTQILLNNLLYDLSQVTIPTDNVDDAILRRPRRWDMRLIRDFMLYIGPISSLYDFLTFWALRVVFHASEKEFHTGWFVESLATQTLVIFVIRTSSRFWEGRPSAPLLITMFVTVCVAVILPYSPLARPLGFVPLPLSFLGFVLAITVTYLAVVELIKRRLLSRFAM